MKVLLIYPPKKHIIPTTLPEHLNEERGYNPPLGLLYVASYLKRFSTHEVMVLDTQVENLDYPEIRERIRETRPDVVGIQALTFTLVDVLEVAKAVKEVSEQILVTIGGPHTSIFPKETVQFPQVDFVVIGEGEKTFTHLLNNMHEKGKIKDIKGICFKENGRVVMTGRPEFLKDLNELPFPDRTLTPYKMYYSLLSKNFPITTMMTSRGCPYRCIFCERLGKKFRAISAKLVVDEIEECLSLGIKEIFVHDDTFTINRKRVLDICNEIHKRKLKFTWDARARVNTVDEELLISMKKAGCKRISYGVEAGNQDILNNLRKDITLAQADRAFKLSKKHGITTLADFMIGSPGEGEQEIHQTIQFAKRLNPNYVQFSVTTPYPGTELYRVALEGGIIKEDVWRKFAKNPTPDFVPPLWEENLTRNQLLGFLNYAYKKFYLSPGFILRDLYHIRSPRELMVKVKAGLKLLTHIN